MSVHCQSSDFIYLLTCNLMLQNYRWCFYAKVFLAFVFGTKLLQVCAERVVIPSVILVFHWAFSGFLNKETFSSVKLQFKMLPRLFIKCFFLSVMPYQNQSLMVRPCWLLKYKLSSISTAKAFILWWSNPSFDPLIISDFPGKMYVDF